MYASPTLFETKVASTSETMRAMQMFSSFRPSEREQLRRLSIDKPSIFIVALKKFLEGWANANWLEEYSVETVGLWIGKNCSDSVIDEARKLASQQAVANDDAISSVRTRTFAIFRQSLQPGQAN